jgi:hypothetical protein
MENIKFQKELQDLKNKINEFSKSTLAIVNQLQLTKEEQIKRTEIEELCKKSCKSIK